MRMAYSPEQKEELRQKIVEIATAQIRENGLSALSARTVAKEAGISAGSLYNYFSDFDTIILTVNSSTLHMLDARLSATAAEHADQSVADRFLALALTYLQFSQDETRLWTSLFEHRMAEGRELSPEHKREHYILFRHVEAPLAEVMKGRSESDLRSTARTIYSSVHGVVSLSLQGRLDRVPLDRLKDQLRLLTTAFAEGYARA